MIALQILIPPTIFDPMAFLIDLAWTLIRSFATFIICFALGLAGLRILDRLTSGIKEVRNIKGQPIPTALFGAGMFVFLALAFAGSVMAPLPIGLASGLGATVSPWLILGYRLTALLVAFVISIVLAVFFYEIMGHLKPFDIDLDDVNKSPLATGIYVMGYTIFLGVILYASLLLPV
jgi:hypothetical protein